jgi:predicted flap endonuclease-1-like 5' DNA nuclease
MGSVSASAGCCGTERDDFLVLQMIQANWLVFIAALLVGIVVAYWIFVQGSKPARRERRPDVLDEGAAPAQRNQALIDSAPAAQFHIDPPAMAGTMAGLGELIAVAAQDEADEKRVHVPPQTFAAEPDPTPAPPAPPVIETGDGEVQADDLRKIKGLGPKMLTVLHALGVTTYAQIAGWTDADLDDLDTKLGAFAGRPRRDNWVEQARLLAGGDTGAYEAKFGKI